MGKAGYRVIKIICDAYCRLLILKLVKEIISRKCVCACTDRTTLYSILFSDLRNELTDFLIFAILNLPPGNLQVFIDILPAF